MISGPSGSPRQGLPGVRLNLNITAWIRLVPVPADAGCSLLCHAPPQSTASAPRPTVQSQPCTGIITNNLYAELSRRESLIFVENRTWNSYLLNQFKNLSTSRCACMKIVIFSRPKPHIEFSENTHPCSLVCSDNSLLRWPGWLGLARPGAQPPSRQKRK